MRICKIEGCERKYICKGLCSGHYNRQLKGVSLSTPLRLIERHGKTRSPEYESWRAMKQRCTNKNRNGYEDYGGRGIIVCERWMNSFSDFLKDIGAKPAKEYSIERKDNDKGYSPDNCYWATPAQQSVNKRIFSNNTSGYVGVRWIEKDKSYSARISYGHKNIWLGCFKNIEDAIEARKQAEKERDRLFNVSQ